MPTPTLNEIINAALDRYRQEKQYPNDTELARDLKVTQKTVSQWRNDKGLCKAARALIPLVYEQLSK